MASGDDCGWRMEGRSGVCVVGGVLRVDVVEMAGDVSTRVMFRDFLERREIYTSSKDSDTIPTNIHMQQQTTHNLNATVIQRQPRKRTVIPAGQSNVNNNVNTSNNSPLRQLKRQRTKTSEQKQQDGAACAAAAKSDQVIQKSSMSTASIVPITSANKGSRADEKYMCTECGCRFPRLRPALSHVVHVHGAPQQTRFGEEEGGVQKDSAIMEQDVESQNKVDEEHAVRENQNHAETIGLSCGHGDCSAVLRTEFDLRIHERLAHGTRVRLEHTRNASRSNSR